MENQDAGTRAHDPARTRIRVGVVAASIALGMVAAWAAWSPAAEPAKTEPAQAPDAQYLEAGRKAPISKAKWTQQASFDFENPADLGKFTVADGQWEIRDGKLWAAAGDKSRSILLTHLEAPTLRIEFDATCYADDTGRIGDVTVMLNASADKAATASGYALTTASYYNTCTTFYRQGKKLARTEFSPVVSGKTSRVCVELDRGHIRYWLNGQIVLEAWDQTPLAIDPALWVGLRTYATKMSVDNLVVSRGAAPAR